MVPGTVDITMSGNVMTVSVLILLSRVSTFPDRVVLLMQYYFEGKDVLPIARLQGLPAAAG